MVLYGAVDLVGQAIEAGAARANAARRMTRGFRRVLVRFIVSPRATRAVPRRITPFGEPTVVWKGTG